MLARQHAVATDTVAPEHYETYERRVSRIPQVIGLVIGVIILVLGIAAVARTGIDTSHIYQPHLVVWHLPHNQLLGMVEIAFGLLVILSSVEPGGTRAALAFFGVVAFAFGLVILLNVAPNHLYDWVGVQHRNGWFFLVAGLLLAIPALLTPDVVEQRVEGDRVPRSSVLRTRTSAARVEPPVQ
jgi:hypothetical protein